MTISVEIGNWFPAPAEAVRPAFAIGDVHGRDDLFQPLIEAIEGIAWQDDLSNALLVALGDYIDRGPGSISALKRALDPETSSKVEFISLPGNHEQYLWAFLGAEGERRAEILESWLDNGGTDVARELRFDPKDVHLNIEAFSNAIRAELGDERLQRFGSMSNHVRIGRYLFVHAGIHPEIGLSMLGRDWRTLPLSWVDEDADPLWIRGPFLTYEGEHEDGVVVVHGHTPRREVELFANRIGIDTRAYDTGRLTAVQLLGSKVRFIQAVGEPRASPWIIGPTQTSSEKGLSRCPRDHKI